MHADYFDKTTMGADYLRNGELYPVDALLDYMIVLMKMREEDQHNELWQVKYTNEINAVKEILKRQTASMIN